MVRTVAGEKYENTKYLEILWTLEGSILDNVVSKMVMTVIISIIASFVHGQGMAMKIPSVAYSLAGAAISFLLVFRSNISYQRFWEGRGHLGTIMMHGRDLARQSAFNIEGDSDGQIRMNIHRYVLVYYRLMAQHVSDQINEDPDNPGSKHPLDNLLMIKTGDKTADKKGILTLDERTILKSKKRRPLVAIAWLTKALVELYQEKRITHMQYESMNQNIRGLIEGFNGVDKVHAVQVPFPYAQMLIIFLGIYCFTIPFMFVQDFGWLAVVPSCVITLAFFGINEVAIEIEDPFGDDDNDLPVDKMGDALYEDLNMYMEMSGVSTKVLRQYYDHLLKQTRREKSERKKRRAELEQEKMNSQGAVAPVGGGSDARP